MIRMTEGLKMTDNLHELRKFVLKDLIKEGYKYIARDKDGAIFAYSRKPNRQDKAWYLDEALNDDIYQNISLVSRIFPDIEWEDVEPFEIPYTNWGNVSVDTKVIVTGVDGSEWKCHFYKKVNDNSILVFRDGKTSWTTSDVVEIDINNVRFE